MSVKPGEGHPLPASDEARQGEIPEGLSRSKGHGDDSRPAVQPAPGPVNPDGEPYPADDGDPGGDPHGAARS